MTQLMGATAGRTKKLIAHSSHQCGVRTALAKEA